MQCVAEEKLLQDDLKRMVVSKKQMTFKDSKKDMSKKMKREN